jgi:hypothetical protein
MFKLHFIPAFVTATALVATLVVAGCHGNSPDGMYTDSTGRLTLEFKGGKAYLNLGGLADTDGTPYDVNGDKITIHYPSDSMMAANSILTINSDGSLQGGMGILKKK